MNVASTSGTEESDLLGKDLELSRSKVVNYSSLESSSISTAASFRSCEVSLLADQLGSVLETTSNETSVSTMSQGNSFTQRNSEDLKVPKEEEFDSRSRELPLSTDANSDANACRIVGSKDQAIADLQASDRKGRTCVDSVENTGIKVLYKGNQPTPDGEEPERNQALFNLIGEAIPSVYLCGKQVHVVPSKNHHKNTLPVPTQFKNSDELVNYYTGKVLRSSDSLYYVEKKLQQALYGAVFLAYELDKCTGECNKSECRERISEPSSLSHSHCTKDKCISERVHFKYDRRKSRVAIKISSMSLKRRKPTLREDIEAEVLYSKKMKGHKNVLEYSEIWQDSFKNIYIKMEYAEHEDLFEVMKKRRKPLTENEARWLFSHIFSAVTFLHNNLMAMRDLSLENVLMFNKEPSFFEFSQDTNVHGVIRPGDTIMYPKITDPGQACEIKKEKKEVFTSNTVKIYRLNPRDSGFQLQKVEFLFGKSFRPPEAYSIGSYYDPTKVDVFCLGWMLLYTLTKYQPFESCRLISENLNDKRNSEGFINNFFRKIVGNNSLTNSIHVAKDKKYTPKDGNWSYIYYGRIYDLYMKIKATRLSPEVLHLIENMLNPDFKERFSMNDVLKHPWLNPYPKNTDNAPIPLTPMMSSTISTPQRQIDHRKKQTNNIVSPSLFFKKIDGSDTANKRCDHKSIHSNQIGHSGNKCNGESKNARVVPSASSDKNEESIKKINNEHINSMIKRTNDKLKVTRISLVSSPNKETYFETTLNRYRVCDSIETTNYNKPSDKSTSEQISDIMNDHYHKINQLKKKKVVLLSQTKPASIIPRKPVNIKIKETEHYFISDLWSFISGNINN